MQQMKFGAFDDICNTSLVLGLHNFRDRNMNQQNCEDHMPKKMKKYDDGGDGDSDGDGCDRLYTCLSLGPPRNQDQGRLQVSSPSIAKINQDNQEVSSFFSSIIKKEKEDRFGGDDQNHVEVERVIVVSSRSDEDIEDGSSPRKKLRLTKEQAVVLEDCFKEHTSLNPKQKQALAEQLNLKPRQVEVWFQNRRARNKLKKNEVDCELLKKCCEALKEENRRLQKEVEELKSLKLANTSSFCMQLPVTTFLKCPSCERAESNGGNDNNNSSSSTIGFTLGVGPPSNKPLLYLPNFNGFSASNSTSISN